METAQDHRTMPRHRIPKLLGALALVAATLGASAADFARSGNLVYNTDVVRIDFTLASAGSVLLWTDSWQAGLNFDPTLSVFDAASRLVATGDDTPDPALLLTGQGGYDSQLRLVGLAAGRYLLTLSASGNDPLGTTLADGFSLAGTPPIAIGAWDQPSRDINRDDQKGSAWHVHLDGVTTAVAAVSPVPEPSQWAMLTFGLVAIAGGALLRRSRSADDGASR